MITLSRVSLILIKIILLAIVESNVILRNNLYIRIWKRCPNLYQVKIKVTFVDFFTYNHVYVFSYLHIKLLVSDVFQINRRLKI